ncbi:hypothetical protein DESA109040_11105 [Deinococcus saxicola]|uniref:hypothetical protein n=1 Tax=Deinococcus saxicola TaxID=249406 RepID=UPI0039F0E245
MEITASADGKTATLVVSTYGLELVVGTYGWNLQPAAPAPGRFIAVRYRPESGESQASTFTVTAPGNEALKCDLSPRNVNNWCWWALPDAAKYPAGESRAGLVQNGLAYAATATVNQRRHSRRQAACRREAALLLRGQQPIRDLFPG